MSDSERAAIRADELESETDPGIEKLPVLEPLEALEAVRPTNTTSVAPPVRLFEHGGLSLYYESWGDDGAPAVVVFHEAGHDLRSWWPVIRALGGDYRVVGIDLPGHGRSPSVEPGAWTVADIAGHAAALLEHLGIAIAAVAGYGLGARIALELAASNPGVIAAAVLADIPASDGNSETYPPDQDVVARRGPRELGKRLGLQVSEQFYRQGLRHRYESMDRDGLLGALMALREPPPEHVVKCPVLICSGDLDSARKDAATLAARLPNCRLLHFREADRPIVHSRPEEFGEQVYRFLRAVEEGNEVSGERAI